MLVQRSKKIKIDENINFSQRLINARKLATYSNRIS